MQLIHTHSVFVFSHFSFTHYHWLIHTILSLFLFQSQLLPISLFLNPSFSIPTPPALTPPLPRHQSEGTGSIVIGLQSWQPYDWAVGYCNWIRLEISLVPVRLLKSQSVVHSWRTFLLHCEWKPLTAAISEWRSDCVMVWGMTMSINRFQASWCQVLFSGNTDKVKMH